MHSNDTEGLVLVVDDQPRNLGVLKTALTREGFEVVVAADAASALRWLKERQPELILLDVMMPDMDGFELCKRIKKNEALNEIPVIFLSGDDNQHSIRNGFKVGGVDYITKPFHKEELLVRVRTHVELRRAHFRHAAQLIERNQMLKLIANEWHQPLQRIVLATSKLASSSKELDHDTMGLFAEEVGIAERMLASIEEFLQFRVVDHEAFGSDDLCRLLGRWYATAKRKPLEIVLRDTASGAELGDVHFMAQQMVDAVLANAIQYTPVNGRVLVSLSREGDDVEMKVCDTGPGFSQQYLQQAFQPWVLRSGAKGGRYSGGDKRSKLGVGLATAKRAADRIGAKLEIENGVDGGALVRMRFPIVRKGKLELPEKPVTSLSSKDYGCFL